MASIKHSGSFNKIEKFLNFVSDMRNMPNLDKYGREGVAALASATPVDSGKTAASWDYEIVEKRGSVTINWTNSNINDGVPVALVLQYGHGTRNGGYVKGIDYINPALKPLFEKIAESAWEEMVRA